MVLPATFTVADGRRITLRPIRPDDAAALRAMFHRLSAESRYQRFFAALTDLSPATLRYLTEVDGDTHIAVVAVMLDEAGGERLVGVARCVRYEGQRDVAEAALTVVDDMQKKGLGARLLAELTAAARARGIRCFRLEVKRANVAMRRLIEEAGGTPVGASGSEMTYDIEIRRSPLRILIQLMAIQTRTFFAVLAPRPGDRGPDARA